MPSGSMAKVSSSAWTMHVGQPRRAEQRDDRRPGPMVPAGLAGRHVQPERVEPVAHDEQAFGVAVDGSRLVADRRGEAGGPGAPRSLEAQLRAAQRLGVLGDAGAQLDQPAADLGEGEDRIALPAAAPAPAGAEAAG